MAYRRKRRAADKSLSKTNRTKTVRIGGVKLSPEDQFDSTVSIQLPLSSDFSDQFPLQGCALMQWGNDSPGTYGTGVGALPIGPSITLQPGPPVLGAFSGISAAEFTQFWGQTTNAGQYFLPCSLNLQIAFDVKVVSGDGGIPWGMTMMDLLQGLMKHHFRLESKARIIRASGQIEECMFELKDITPQIGFTSTCPDIGGDSGTGIGGGTGTISDGWMQSCALPPVGNGAIQYHIYYTIPQVAANKCFWRLQGLNYHPINQVPGMVNGPYGQDPNFGIDRNNSYPIDNYFEYGDKIYMEGINVIQNPYWGTPMCGYSILIDEDGDGVADNAFGTWVLDENGNIAYPPGNPETINSADADGSVAYNGNLKTMVPSEPKLLDVV
jgi:hypothetical protein